MNKLLFVGLLAVIVAAAIPTASAINFSGGCLNDTVSGTTLCFDTTIYADQAIVGNYSGTDGIFLWNWTYNESGTVYDRYGTEEYILNLSDGTDHQSQELYHILGITLQQDITNTYINEYGISIYANGWNQATYINTTTTNTTHTVPNTSRTSSASYVTLWTLNISDKPVLAISNNIDTGGDGCSFRNQLNHLGGTVSYSDEQNKTGGGTAWIAAGFNDTIPVSSVEFQALRHTDNGGTGCRYEYETGNFVTNTTVLNPVMIANLTAGNYTVWINDSTHALQQTTVTLPTTTNYTALSLTAQTTNTFNISFYNETTNELLTTTVTYQIISSSETRNGTTTNGSAVITLLTPDSYEIVYWYDADVPRRYYVTLTNQSAENLRLYTIDEDISSWYVAVVEDPSSSKCADMNVSLLRYYIDINGYRVVEMAQTDTNGQAVFRVQPNIIPYKFSFSGSCGSFVSSPSKLIDSSNTYTVTDAQSVLTSTFLSVSSSLTYNNATRTFTYTWSDTTNIVERGCLYLTRIAGGTRSLYNTTCDSVASGSVIYTLTPSEAANASYIARGAVKTNTEFSEVSTDQIEISFFDRTSIANIAPIAAALLLSSLILFASYSAATLIVAAIAGISILAWTGLAPFSWATVTAWIILGGVVLYRLRR